MPIPEPSYSDFQSAYALYSKEDFLPEQGFTVTVQDDDGDDNYWNAYGQSDDTDQPPISANAKQDSALNSEDAYWAQYSSVQGQFTLYFLSLQLFNLLFTGSGDSTLPSPRPEKQNFGAQRIIIPSDDFQIHRTEPYNPLEPPSPEKLAERLAALSPRPDSPPFPDEDDSLITDSNSSSPHLTQVESTGVSASPRQIPDKFILVDSVPATVDITGTNLEQDPRDTLLKQHIVSLYQLWSLSKPSNVSNDQDKQSFISAVQAAIDHL
ncbi:hypothetical protein CVT24_011591 [Panaeolus cyanescens]|uniref:Uncharacterized protein n=1 Tax=Panaeolus cyanescens TaxID=181874 RepID=A0A409YV59_9AGAR|nr:hypothetical protein CVT24_011591 [Panaeolus cyanescens]